MPWVRVSNTLFNRQMVFNACLTEHRGCGEGAIDWEGQFLSLKQTIDLTLRRTVTPQYYFPICPNSEVNEYFVCPWELKVIYVKKKS